MPIPRFVRGIVWGGLMGLAVNTVSSQDYPNRPVRIVTSEPGGSTDLVSRIIAPNLAANLGQQVIVDNRGGATGARAAATVSQASPDGHTLLIYSSGLWLSPLLRGTLPFDPEKDFSSITIVDKAPNVLFVHPSIAANSVKELIALVQAKSREFSYGSGGVGSSPHLAAELFKALAGISMVHIPYKGGALAVNATISGEVQLSFPTTGAVAPHLKSGRVRALAVTSAQGSALAPGLPTMTASGLPGYESAGSAAIFSTAKTPAAVIKRLNQEIVLVLNQADVKERFLRAGVEVASGSPQQLTAYIKSEITTMGKVIKDAGITGD